MSGSAAASAVEATLTPEWELISQMAAMPCFIVTPEPCGGCFSCRARLAVQLRDPTLPVAELPFLKELDKRLEAMTELERLRVFAFIQTRFHLDGKKTKR